MKNKSLPFISCVVLLLALLLVGLSACKGCTKEDTKHKNGNGADAQLEDSNDHNANESPEVNDESPPAEEDEANEAPEAIMPENSIATDKVKTSQKVKLPFSVYFLIIIGILQVGVLGFLLHRLHQKINKNVHKIEFTSDTIRKIYHGMTYHKKESGDSTDKEQSDNKELVAILMEIDERIRELFSIIKNIKIDVPEMQMPEIKMPDIDTMMAQQSDNILSAIQSLNLNDTIELHSLEAMSELDEIKNSFKEIHSELGKVYHAIVPRKDKRFLNLRIHFSESYELVRLKLYDLEKETQDINAEIKSFIEDFSLIISLHAISSDKETLKKAYVALGDILEEYQLDLILPIPGDDFDENLMDQAKIYGDSNKVDKVVYPGFKHDDYICKAKVDVR